MEKRRHDHAPMSQRMGWGQTPIRRVVMVSETMAQRLMRGRTTISSVAPARQ
jgi:hypothetical protein